jgi:hypothetical protein
MLMVLADSTCGCGLRTTAEGPSNFEAGARFHLSERSGAANGTGTSEKDARCSIAPNFERQLLDCTLDGAKDSNCCIAGTQHPGAAAN